MSNKNLVNGNTIKFFTVHVVLKVSHQQSAFSMKLLNLQKREGKIPLVIVLQQSQHY